MNEHHRETHVRSAVVSDACKPLQQYWQTGRLYQCM